MNIVYMGAAPIAVNALRRMASFAPEVILTGVVSQPDRPAGRRRRLTPSEVSQAALEMGLPLCRPERVAEPSCLEWLKARDAELFVVFAFGQFLPRSVRDLPPLRSVNIHPSRLPLDRGAAPIPWTIARGETRTAVSLIAMEKEMDAGDVLACRDLDILPEDTSGTLGEKAAVLGADLVLETVRAMRAGTLRPVPQDGRRATHARKLEKHDGQIPWGLPAREVHNRVRAFDPWPGSFFLPPGGSITEPVKVWKTRVESAAGDPGAILDLQGDGPLVACGESAVRLLEVQPPGKRRMSGTDFLHGSGWNRGMVLA